MSIITCSWCLEAQIIFEGIDELDNNGWEVDEDDRAYCPSCLKWFDGTKGEFNV